MVDFLDFYWGRSHFPAFNVADMGITSGAVLLIPDEVLRAKHEKAKTWQSIAAIKLGGFKSEVQHPWIQ